MKDLPCTIQVMISRERERDKETKKESNKQRID